MSLLLSTLTISLVSSSFYHELEERIVNGMAISANEYPWMVSMRYEFEYGIDSYTISHHCGSTNVLTAAHCVEQDVSANLIGNSTQYLGASLEYQAINMIIAMVYV